MLKTLLKRDALLLCRRNLPFIPLINLGLATLFLEWIGGHTPLALKPYIAGIFIFLIFLNILGSIDTLYQEDFKRGCLEDICLKTPFVTFILSRFLCFYGLIVLPSISMLPLLVYLFGVTFFLMPLFWGGFFISLLFTGLATATSLLTLGYSSAQSLLMILVMPLFVPLFIILAVFLESLMTPFPHFYLLTTLGGACLVLLPLCLTVSSWALQTTLMDNLE